MGKRKKAAKKPQGPKKKEPLPTSFPCLFCNHEKSVTVKLEKKAGTGDLSCKVCGQSFQTGINCEWHPNTLERICGAMLNYITLPVDLSAAVDVYSDWIDACDAVAKEAGESTTRENDYATRILDVGPATRRGSDRDLQQRMIDETMNDDIDAEGEYADD
ncbi:MAG: hypothetical protein M1836_002440 [Candelina mexicana]|nr:MAG: hypothetical protein M1836_002440 [Candelina mexicana]